MKLEFITQILEIETKLSVGDDGPIGVNEHIGNYGYSSKYPWVSLYLDDKDVGKFKIGERIRVIIESI